MTAFLPARFLSTPVLSALFALYAGSSTSAYAQDLFIGTKSSGSVAVAGADLAAPHGILGALTAGNPAGLGSIEGRSVEVSGIAVVGHGHYTSPSASKSNLNPLLGLAPSVAIATPIGKTPWRISLSATPDTSLSADWSYNDAPGTAGVTYGYQQNKSSLLNERIAVGVSHPLGNKVQVGATLGLVYESTTLIAPTIFQNQPVLKGLKTLLTLKTSGIGWNGTAGVIYTPIRKLQFGLAYKSPTYLHTTGTADGNLSALLAALGLTGSFRPDFHYTAGQDNALPQTLSAGAAWNATRRVHLYLRGDFVNWANSFNHLALQMSNGNNADLNKLVGSTGFQDSVPLNWKNQGIAHIGAEYLVKGNFIVRGGFVAGNNPVPSSTLTPLTAAITEKSLAAGVGYHSHRYNLDAAYQAGLSNTASVGPSQSILRAGEYNNSQTELGTQTFSTTFSMLF